MSADSTLPRSTGSSPAVSSPGPAALTGRPCPLCAKPAQVAFRPFCSRGCRDRDLNAWFDEDYRLAAPPPSDEGDDGGDDGRGDGGDGTTNNPAGDSTARGT